MSNGVQRILCLSSIAFILVGCGSSTQIPADNNSTVSISESGPGNSNEAAGAVSLDVATENTSQQEEVVEIDVSNAESQKSSETAWIEAYISYLKDLDTFSYPHGGFIYLDDDDIPEIALEGNAHADGSMILAIGSDNSVKENGFAENHVYYVPRGGAVFDFRPGGGGVSEGVSQLKDKEWEDLFRGEFICDHYPDSDYYKDFEGNNYEVYEGGAFEIGKEKSVSGEEYYSMLQAAFDKCGFDDTKAKNTKDDIKYTVLELIEELDTMQSATPAKAASTGDNSVNASSESKTSGAYDSGDLYCVYITQFENKSDYEKLEDQLYDITSNLFLPIINTSDYSGLEPDSNYVVTTWVYSSPADAERDLRILKSEGYSDAYIKNIGKYVGEKCWLQFDYHSSEDVVKNVEILNDCIILHNVQVLIPNMFSIEPAIMDIVIDADTSFYDPADMESVINYKNGMTPYQWIDDCINLRKQEKYGPFDDFIVVSFNGNCIKTIYSSFYWDI